MGDNTATSNEGEARAQHLCILIHGLWGNPKHLSFLAQALRAKHSEHKLHILVPKANQDSFTYDGIDLGAERITQEIEEYIKHLETEGNSIKRLSVVGYSLGGLVARYVIGLLYTKSYFDRIEPVNFTTFATPHLGVRTPILGYHSRLWNLLGSSTLSASGRQLFTIDTFRNSDKSLVALLADPSTIFIQALRLFRKRVLYANCVNDRSAPYYTTCITGKDPFQNLESISLNYLPDYEPNILDPENPITVLPETDQAPLVTRVVSSTQTMLPQIPLYALLTVLIPIGSVAFFVNSGIQSIRSQRRIRLHEEGKAGIGFGNYRIPFVIENAKEAVTDALERVNSRQGALLSRSESFSNGSVAKPNLPHGVNSDQSKRIPDLALSPEQFEMIRNLDEVGFTKFRPLSDNIHVQSFSSAGRAKLAVNVDGGRAMCQLHPGQSIWLADMALTIVPKEHADLPLITSPYIVSWYDSDVDHISQPQHFDGGLEDTENIMSSKTPQQMEPAIFDDGPGSNPSCETPDHSDCILTERSPNAMSGTKLLAHPSVFGPRDLRAITLQEDEDGMSTNVRQEDRDLLLEPQQQRPTPTKRTLSRAAFESQDTQDSLKGSIFVNRNHAEAKQQDDSAVKKRRITGSEDRHLPSSTPELSKGGQTLPEPSVTSFASARRSSRAKAPGGTPVASKGGETCVVFASTSAVGESSNFRKFLNKQKVRISTSVQECTALIVGKGEIKKTAKMLMAIQLGKQIIHDAWATESAKAGRLLDMAAYQAADPLREVEWGVNLKEAVKRGREGVRAMDGYDIVFTPAVKKEVGNGFKDLKELASMAGASSISNTLPKTSYAKTSPTIVIATSDHDPALKKLNGTWKGFSRDIISMSVLRGILDTESDEFLVHRASDSAGRK
ncbi:uncharacterized protein KY384_008356 [Bacidia gigantensis]|uniref:uncharacterized protein n=1 Tax=Bacidia gigantensis TaxID=2732470 RepID=UPI001D047FBB|nr:uncharacterized protein KY384_008356 [Bacidia gigantensis]KAG8526927.1 hypothetical protein KY384_008356 [Bacidia gigantensis]